MKNTTLIAGIIIFVIVLAIDVITDLRLGYTINHTRGLILRCIGILPCLICFVIASDNQKIFLMSFVVLAMVGINYMNLFDGFYNIFRGHGWFFTGSEDGAGDAKTDNFLQAIPLWAQVLFKIGGSISMIFIYIKLKK